MKPKTENRERMIAKIKSLMKLHGCTFHHYYADRRVTGIDGYQMKWYRVVGMNDKTLGVLVREINNNLATGYYAVVTNGIFNNTRSISIKSAF